MVGYTVNTGSSKEFASGWDRVFTKPGDATTKKAKKKAKAKTTAKTKAVKKKVAVKKVTRRKK